MEMDYPLHGAVIDQMSLRQMQRTSLQSYSMASCVKRSSELTAVTAVRGTHSGCGTIAESE